MVDWTDIPDRNRGQIRPRYSANVAPIVPGQDDARSAHLRNTAIQRANEVRKQRATVENPQWAMSRPPEWYQNRENLASVKDTLANVKGNRDFFTTNQDESRNMYQMIMNNMVGGGGARMLDTRGLPSQAYRTGRKIWQNPSKSAGFLNDLKVMLGDVTFQDKRWPEEKRTSNPAAIHVDEWNPLHEEGYGRDWYVDQFGEPWGDKLEGLMKLALPGPLKFMAGKEREPLPSDRSWIPENVGAYNEIPEIPFMGDEIIEDDYIYDPFWRGQFPGDPKGNVDSGYYGIGPSSYMDDLTEKIVEEGDDITNEYDEIFNEDVFNKVFAFPESAGFTNFPSAFEGPWNLFEAVKENMKPNEWTDQELLDLLIKRGYLRDTTLEE